MTTPARRALRAVLLALLVAFAVGFGVGTWLRCALERPRVVIGQLDHQSPKRTATTRALRE